MTNKPQIVRTLPQQRVIKRDDDFEEIPDNLGQRAS
jgi:hypothetical protein